MVVRLVLSPTLLETVFALFGVPLQRTTRWVISSALNKSTTSNQFLKRTTLARVVLLTKDTLEEWKKSPNKIKVDLESSGSKTNHAKRLRIKTTPLKKMSPDGVSVVVKTSPHKTTRPEKALPKEITKLGSVSLRAIMRLVKVSPKTTISLRASSLTKTMSSVV